MQPEVGLLPAAPGLVPAGPGGAPQPGGGEGDATAGVRLCGGRLPLSQAPDEDQDLTKQLLVVYNFKRCSSNFVSHKNTTSTRIYPIL